MTSERKPEARDYFVTEFKNQFDEWQPLHATRSKAKAFADAGQSGRVIHTIEVLQPPPDEAAAMEKQARSVVAKYEMETPFAEDSWTRDDAIRCAQLGWKARAEWRP